MPIPGCRQPRILLSAILCASLLHGLAATESADARAKGRTEQTAVDLVNPLAGTVSGQRDYGTGGGAGNTFPGAVVPFGMVQPSPETVPSTDNFAAGYSYRDRLLRGFGLTHYSGAGCALLQDVPIQISAKAPTRAPVKPGSSDLWPEFLRAFDHRHERAEPGYYAVTLDPLSRSATRVELTATRRVAWFRFTLPTHSRPALLINAGGSAMANGLARVRVDPRSGAVSGEIESGRACYQRNSYRVYFYAQPSRRPQAIGVWQDRRLLPGGRNAEARSANPANYKPIPGGPPALPGNPSTGAQAGAYLVFDARTGRRLELRVGISYTSVKAARANLRAETEGVSFSRARQGARAAWRSLLERITIDGGKTAERATFYTALYHALVQPTLVSDVSGTYPGFDGRVRRSRRPRYGNFSGWDVWRTQVPLLTLIAPRTARDLVASLLASQRESGCLPKWTVLTSHTNVMVGDPASIVAATASAWRVPGIRASELLTPLLAGAERECTTANGYVQREALAPYLSTGYIPFELNTDVVGHTVDPKKPWGVVATALEYAAADFAIAQVAMRAGAKSTAERLAERARRAWRVTFDGSFQHPRRLDGSFRKPFDPASDEGFVEGSAAQYTLLPSWDIDGLRQALGGADALRRRLDTFFKRLNAGPRSTQAFLANEPTLHTPWLYLATRCPQRAGSVVRRATRSLWSAKPTGIPGNDDAGALSSWYVWSTLGLYPFVPGSDLLAVSQPLFARVVVRAPGRAAVEIRRQRVGARQRGLAVAVDGAPQRAPWLRGTALFERGRRGLRRVVVAAGGRCASSPPPVPSLLAGAAAARAARSASYPRSAAHRAASARSPRSRTLQTRVGRFRIVVQRQPFALRALDARGRLVLRSASAERDGKFALQPMRRSLFGKIDDPRPALYAPFGMLVGQARIDQVASGIWVGNLSATEETGVEYGATSLASIRRIRGGVLLTLRTADPAGRRLLVAMRRGPSGTLDISVRPDRAQGVAEVFAAFVSPRGERFFGFGGRHNRLDQRGTSFLDWIQQENVASGSRTSWTAPRDPLRDRYLFPNGEHAAYYLQSLFVSSRGYGALAATLGPIEWRLASDRKRAWRVAAWQNRLRLLVAAGGVRSAVSALNAVNGRHPVPPAWALGGTIDRLVRLTPDPPAKYAAQIEDDIATIKRLRLPIEAYRIEAWESLPRPQLRSLIARLRRLGIKPLVYFRLFVGRDDIGTDNPRLFDEAVRRGLVARRSDGSPYIFTSNFGREAAIIDFTNPAAVRWWRERIREALDLGAEGFMQDFGEQVFDDMHFYDGRTGRELHNALPALAHRATRLELERYQRTHPGRRLFFFTRAGGSGTPGAARFENANFPGDETTDWSRASGIASLTPDMLNRSIGGAFGFTTDIGGYFDIGPNRPTTPELFVRWAEWSALTPFFRVHGSLLAGTHVPWSYGPRVLDRYRRLLALHLAARPRILALWRRAAKTGIPVVGPLWLAYPRDRRAAAQDQEWLLGPDVLVAPVVVEGARSRDVYFPRGCWRDPRSGRAYRGPRTVRVAAPLGHLPFFFRCGTRPFRVPPATP